MPFKPGHEPAGYIERAEERLDWNESGGMAYYGDMKPDDPNYPCHWSTLGSIHIPVPDPDGEDEGEYDGVWYPSFSPSIRMMQLMDGYHPITGKDISNTYSYTHNDEYKDEYGGGD